MNRPRVDTTYQPGNRKEFAEKEEMLLTRRRRSSVASDSSEFEYKNPMREGYDSEDDESGSEIKQGKANSSSLWAFRRGSSAGSSGSKTNSTSEPDSPTNKVKKP